MVNTGLARNEFGAGKTAFIRASDLADGRVLFDTADHINDVALARIRKGIGRPGDVLFSHKGTVGKLALVPADAPPFVCSPQTTFWRTLGDDQIDRRFLYYFMASTIFKNQWYVRKGETDMADYVSLTAQRDLFLAVPPIDEQRAIVSLLHALDRKIDLNRQMNNTLEATAQAIFKSWFVDFDPVVAKAVGRRPFGMGTEISALFPDRFIDSRVGPIPEEWTPETIAAVARYINGKNFTRAANRTGRMVIRIAELNSGPGPSTIYTDIEAPPENTDYPGDLLFSWSGSLDVYRWYRDEALINQHIFKVIPNDLPQWFVHYHLKDAMEFFQGIASDKATTMGHIKREHLSQVDLVLPPRKVTDAADRIIGRLYEQLLQNELESVTLVKIRDTLLPKFLSGEVRLTQVEQVIQEAI
jgi:type I restriction enzyme, S subunit